MQFLWKYIDDLVGKGLNLFQVAELMMYSIARFLPLALPIAVLISSVMVIGQLGENYELAALQSSGISLLKIMHLSVVVTEIFIVMIAMLCIMEYLLILLLLGLMVKHCLVQCHYHHGIV